MMTNMFTYDRIDHYILTRTIFFSVFIYYEDKGSITNTNNFYLKNLYIYLFFRYMSHKNLKEILRHRIMFLNIIHF